MLANALQAGGNPSIVIAKYIVNVSYVCVWWLFILTYLELSNIFCLSTLFTDDYIAIGADCDELGAQIEEYILCIG